MSSFKSVFISSFMMVLVATLSISTWKMGHDGDMTWAATFAAALAPGLFFARIFVLPTARTSANLLWMPSAGVLVVVWAMFSGNLVAITLAALAGVVGPLTYIFWYSRLGSRDEAAIKTGGRLPAFSLEQLDGSSVSSDTLAQNHALWLFYRGNWCPFCMAQVKELAARYRELADKGVSIYLISPQPQDHSRDLATHFQVPMQFLTDPDNTAARRLGILAKNGLPAGLQVLGYDSDVPLPTVFITRAGGEIIYSDLTENYRIRPEPDAFLGALVQAGL